MLVQYVLTILLLFEVIGNGNLVLLGMGTS